MSTILGLDVSTSATGFCILDLEGNLLDLGYISLSKTKDLVSKGSQFRIWLQDKKHEYNISEVYIEEPLQRYASGMSSARTITRLASFNGIVQYICFDEISVKPELISVSEARKLCGIKTISKKKAGKDVKEQVFDWVNNHLNYNWPTKILQSGPRKGKTIIIPESRDMADAWVVTKAGFVKNSNSAV
tara:strand:- start:559 stop:1122 length:564 start_codon:yes stop_codon:yes gene_type:complete